MSPKGRFLLRKLHSLSGVVPVGAFLCEHLWTNAAALSGRSTFDHAVGEIQHLPMLPLLEIGGILLPLSFHAIYGLALAREAKPNVGAYPTTRNWMYVLQRVTGVIVFAFVLAHLWEYRIQKWLFGMDASAFYGTMEAHLSWVKWGVPWIAVGYLVGLASATFHLANGLWGFATSWGLTVSRRAQARFGVACAAFGASLFAVGALTVISIATGTRFGVPPEALPGSHTACPAPK